MSSEVSAQRVEKSTQTRAAQAHDGEEGAQSFPLSYELNHPEERKRALYQAFSSKDARFDGQVFVGVSSTGIYCRPVCHVKMPKYENCTFFASAAEAEAAGYRPCLVCRPETAPGMSRTDAASSLARRTARLLREQCASGESLAQLAGKLGYTERHVRRAFEREFNVAPARYRETCRLLLAKSLLTETGLPVSQVASASGFGSARRFNDAFQKHYRMPPSRLRKGARSGAAEAKRSNASARADASASFTISLGYRTPYRWDDLLAFFRMRQLDGVEKIDGSSYARAVRLALPDGNAISGWFRVKDNPKRHALSVTVSESLAPAIAQLVARIRLQFDLESDPAAVYAGIQSLNDVVPGAAREGVRLPGCFDPFEMACRAVIGQQVSVKAANRIAARIAESFGERVETGAEGLSCVWPTPAEMLALGEPLSNALGPLGVIRTRAAAIRELARQMDAGELDLSANAIATEQYEKLTSVRGLGAWTANYLLMRTMSYPDAFLETDAGVKHALPDRTPKERVALAEAWRPWRSYAVVSLWNSLGS